MPDPFKASPCQLSGDLNPYIDSVMDSLQSRFLELPLGADFIRYKTFQSGYEALRKTTSGFSALDASALTDLVFSNPMSLIVLRTMLGFTPPEWAYVTSERSSTEVPQNYARSLERRIRRDPTSPLTRSALANERVSAMINVACSLLSEGAPRSLPQLLHRLDKADTKAGLESIAHVASMGVPYAMLLYERYLGRPFASHRDAVSELVANLMEGPIETLLSSHGIPYRKTQRAESIVGFDQAPDFFIPDEFAPVVVVEAKITEDEGTARDKVTRVQHLAELSQERRRNDEDAFEVVACIDGRGFTRRSDMEKLILATKGKVFTLNTLDMMVRYTRLSEFTMS